MLITYDISTRKPSGRKRLSKIAKCCENFGLRVQYSIFECDVDPALWEEFKHKLLGIYEPDEDSLRFYHLGSNWKGKVEHYGSKKIVDPIGDTLLF